MKATIKSVTAACLILASLSAIAAADAPKGGPCTNPDQVNLQSGGVYICGPQGWMPVADDTPVQAQIIFTIENSGKSVEVPLVLMRGHTAYYSSTSEMSYVAKAEAGASGVNVTTEPLSTGVTVRVALNGFDERGNALVDFSVKQSSLTALENVTIGDLTVQKPDIAHNDISQSVVLDASGGKQSVFFNAPGFRVAVSLHNIVRAGEAAKQIHG